MKLRATNIVLSAGELREREIQEAEWANEPPMSSLGQMLRDQNILRFNQQMTRKYGHLRRTADNDAYKRFSEVGALLYGHSWKGPLAHDLGVVHRTVQRWADGTSPIPDGIKTDLAKLCRKHAAVLVKTADELEGK